MARNLYECVDHARAFVGERRKLSGRDITMARWELEELIARIDFLRGPIWNDKGVLVWSMLDAERMRAAADLFSASLKAETEE